ncbi:MAG: hypothetical protein JXE06_10625 [Coriobacteriia bacterium]|nr:hypothetical protein [Coriobacteriia bacterium]MBN2823380.1 hypothetical protein [Coriobacteriia bacterium]
MDDLNTHRKSFHDLYVPVSEARVSVTLDDQMLRDTDIVLVVTDHQNVNYDAVVRNAPLILDTRNALKSFNESTIVSL